MQERSVPGEKRIHGNPLEFHLRTFATVKSYMHLHAKGWKERSVPLWPRTALAIKEWLREIGRNDNALVFPNLRGEPLSRFAIHLLLREAVQRAVSRCPSLRRKRISPHVIRHGTAMALLQAWISP
jgi:integrase/recombinase XerD